jgi:uncharacterized membrane protein
MAKEHDDSFSKARMESLTDGIFATVMTILILSLVVPIITGQNQSEGLMSVMVSLVPSILIYVFSFTVLLVMWIGHNNLFRYVHSINPKMLWLNGLFLLLIGIVPLSTAFLGKYLLSQPAILLYGVNFLLLALMFKTFAFYIKRHHYESDSVLEKTTRNNTFGVVLYICAIAASFVNSYISLGFFALMPLFYLYQAFFGMYKEIK